MTQFTHLSRSTYEAWLVRLGTACLMVAGNSPSLVTSVTVSKHFEDLADSDRDVLLDLARRLAEEYSLALEHSESVTSITVRFSRKSVPADANASGAGVGDSSYVGVSS